MAERQQTVPDVIDALGGRETLQDVLDVGRGTVAYWIKTGHFPVIYRDTLKKMARSQHLWIDDGLFTVERRRGRKRKEKSNASGG